MRNHLAGTVAVALARNPAITAETRGRRRGRGRGRTSSVDHGHGNTPRRLLVAGLGLAVALGAACTSGEPGTTAVGGSGGASTSPASGGASAASSGGTIEASSGGSTTVSSGGASAVSSGGASSTSDGGASTVSSGGASGGSSLPPVKTGGTSSPPGDTGGSTGTLGGAGGSSGGSSSSSSGGSVGGKGGTASGNGGASGSGGASARGGGGSSGGAVGSGGATSSTLAMPPVRDTASKVPISSSPGNTVEGNYAYGPLTAQRLDIIYPPGAGPKGTQVLPMVVMFHGGAWIHSYTNDYGSGKDHMSTFFDRFLKHGFMVCNAEYRVNDNTADGAVAPADVQDALLAAKWCWDYMDYFHGDRTRYVVTGASAGGHLALMVGMTSADAGLGPTSPTDFKIAAIVDGYGPADIEAEVDAVAKGWIPASLPNRMAIAKQVSPMTYVRKDIPPLIVVQGANDNTAPVADSLKLVANLKTAGDTDVTMHEVAGAGHGFTTPATAWPDAEAAMFNWLTGKGIGK